MKADRCGSAALGKRVYGAVVIANASVGQFELHTNIWHELTFEIGKDIIQE